MARKTKVREHDRTGTSGVREHSRTLPDAPMGNQKGNFKPVKSTKRQIQGAVNQGKKLIKQSLSDDDYARLKYIKLQFDKGYDTRAIYTRYGKYIDERKRLHNRIIKDILKGDTKTKDPDLYVLGGVAGSGKTSVLLKRVKERAVVINNDDIKKELAKETPAPTDNYFLMHAPLLHRESSDVEKKLIKKAIKSDKDIILDRTLSNLEENLDLIEKFRKEGYDIHTHGTNHNNHIAIIRASQRFVKKGKEGRYVPLEVIARKANQTNENVMNIAKRDFNDSAVVIDTTTRDNKILYEKN